MRVIKNYIFFKKHIKKIIIVSGIIVILGIITKVVMNTYGKPPQIPNKIVEVQPIIKQDIQQTIRLLGTLHPKHATTLVAKGVGLLDELVPTGHTVTKGTLIATIDNPDVEKNLQLSIRTEALAKAQVERLKPLFEKGYVSAKDLEEKKEALLNAKKEVSRAKIERDNLRFYAPFDGIIGAYKKREGTQVNQGEAVVTLYDPTSLVVDLDIPCTQLKKINVGQPLYIFKKRYHLSHVQKMLDSESHMCPADVSITCTNCVIGSTVPVDLVISEKKEAIVIPFQAIFLKNSKPFVYVVENGKVVLVPVKTGLKQKDSIEISEGLKEGQKLIIKGQERLYPELAVDIYSDFAVKTERRGA